jgi:predicted RNA-binding Zn-ribbon protein involved in translation (DUF1610 family)
MELKCALCEKDLVDPKISTTGLVAHEFNTKYYCNECYEAVQFADMVSQPNIIKEKKKIEKKENIPPMSVISYRCVNCKNQASGNKCDNCGTPSPLMSKKKKF